MSGRTSICAVYDQAAVLSRSLSVSTRGWPMTSSFWPEMAPGSVSSMSLRKTSEAT